jgi:predicted alpha/beta hydrolase family esterase
MTFKTKNDYFDFLLNRPISIEERVRRSNEYLQIELKLQCKIIKPYMPCKDNAKYIEWKMHFERYLQCIDDKTILIGQSLGGIFLAKYLSENKLFNKVLSVYLVCPPFDNTLPDEALVGWFKLSSDLSLLEENCNNLYLMFSKDDPIVPVNHSEKYRKKLHNANILIYENKNGHFKVEEFPEIVQCIQKDISAL